VSCAVTPATGQARGRPSRDTSQIRIAATLVRSARRADGIRASGMFFRSDQSFSRSSWSSGANSTVQRAVHRDLGRRERLILKIPAVWVVVSRPAQGRAIAGTSPLELWPSSISLGAAPDAVAAPAADPSCCVCKHKETMYLADFATTEFVFQLLLGGTTDLIKGMDVSFTRRDLSRQSGSSRHRAKVRINTFCSECIPGPPAGLIDQAAAR